MDPLSTHVGFQADLPSAAAHAPDSPAGGEVVDLLEAELPRHGLKMVRRGTTDYSHFFDLAAEPHVFFGMVGLIDEQEWLLFAESTLGWWRRMRRTSDEQEHRLVMNAIQAVLEGDPRIEELHSYRDADHWNREGP